MRWWHGALVVIVVAWLPMGPGNPSVGAAQQEAGLGAPVLTLDEALGIALQNNVNVVNAQLGVLDPDAAAAHLAEKGIAFDGPRVAPYGMKQLWVRDPDGYMLCFQAQA